MLGCTCEKGIQNLLLHNKPTRQCSTSCTEIYFFDRSVQIKKVKIHSNTAYGVVPPRKDEPTYDIIGIPLSRNAATESTEM